MAKIEQGTLQQCCLTCGAYQAPDGGDAGLCFDPRHESKRALHVREANVCHYWHARKASSVAEPIAPASLTDRIFAALLFSAGGAPRGCREIKDWIDLQFSTVVLAADVARILQHQVSAGRVAIVDGWYRWNDARTWVDQYSAILDTDGARAIRFAATEATRCRFFVAFCGWVPRSRGPSYSFDGPAEARELGEKFEREADEAKARIEKARLDVASGKAKPRAVPRRQAPLSDAELDAFSAKLKGGAA